MFLLHLFWKNLNDFKLFDFWLSFQNIFIFPLSYLIAWTCSSLGFLLVQLTWETPFGKSKKLLHLTTNDWPQLLTTSTKSWKSSTFFFWRMRCSTWWWKLSADINVWPCSKYFRVTDDAYPPSELTSLRRAVYKYQFLFCEQQFSKQKLKSYVSQFFLIKLTNVLATSANYCPLIPSWQSTPVVLSFPFFDPRKGANLSLNTRIRLQTTTTFNQGIVDNIITFCILTNTTFPLSVGYWFFFHLSLASVVVLIKSSK